MLEESDLPLVKTCHCAVSTPGLACAASASYGTARLDAQSGQGRFGPRSRI